MLRKLYLLAAVMSLLGCISVAPQTRSPAIETPPMQVAFLADIHFHDVYGELDNTKRDGLVTATPHGKEFAWIRSLRAQLHSTRLFNENYFVLLAALDDLAKRGIQLVALPGDFTDDGQPMHVQGLAKLLQHYQQQHGMRFFAIPGNHDPVRPFTIEGGKKDFLGSEGNELAVYSLGSKECQGPSKANVVCSDSLKKWGYAEIFAAMQSFGLAPDASYLYYETPFSHNHGDPFDLTTRTWQWCEPEPLGQCVGMPDTSYLVEPIEGLWLLAIDANVYAPKNPNVLTNNGQDYRGSSNAGYNALAQYKPELLSWITDVVQRAKQQKKKLIAFSHFPMVDFYDAAGDDIATLFGADKQQLKRLPLRNTAKVLANTGLRLHVGGHMHINDTGTVLSDKGEILVNIQAPTLAAYRPGYKLMTYIDDSHIDVETVVLDEVERFNELFPHYHKEHRHLVAHAPDSAWDLSILSATNYTEFTDKHLTELVKLRYLPKEWPAPLVNKLQTHSLYQLMQQASQCAPDKAPSYSKDDIEWMKTQSGHSLINDFYRLRNADSIALVPQFRQDVYTKLAAQYTQCKNQSQHQDMTLLLAIVAKFIRAQPSENIRIDLINNSIMAR